MPPTTASLTTHDTDADVRALFASMPGEEPRLLPDIRRPLHTGPTPMRVRIMPALGYVADGPLPDTLTVVRPDGHRHRAGYCEYNERGVPTYERAAATVAVDGAVALPGARGVYYACTCADRSRPSYERDCAIAKAHTTFLGTLDDRCPDCGGPVVGIGGPTAGPPRQDSVYVSRILAFMNASYGPSDARTCAIVKTLSDLLDSRPWWTARYLPVLRRLDTDGPYVSVRSLARAAGVAYDDGAAGRLMEIDGYLRGLLTAGAYPQWANAWRSIVKNLLYLGTYGGPAWPSHEDVPADAPPRFRVEVSWDFAVMSFGITWFKPCDSERDAHDGALSRVLRGKWTYAWSGGLIWHGRGSRPLAVPSVGTTREDEWQIHT